MTQVFKIGDRVIVVGESKEDRRRGKLGTVVYVEGSYGIHVSLDDDSLNVNTHSYHETTKCYYYHASDIVDVGILTTQVPPSVKENMTKTLIELTDEQVDTLSPEDQALVELGIVNDKLVLTEGVGTNYVIRQWYKANKAVVGKQAVEDVKKIKKASK